MKHKVLLAILITNFILVSCSSSAIKQTSKNNNSNSTNSQYTGSGKNSTITTTESGVVVKVISVDQKCIGCGKCARIDSLHFQMNRSTHKAEPIQAKGHYGQLQNAIDDCPVGAISVSYIKTGPAGRDRS